MSHLVYKPEKVFRRGKLQVAATTIKRPLPSRWLALVIASEVVLIRANWPIVPQDEGEINENSRHPLVQELQGLDLLGFSIYGDSMMIEPFKETWEITEKVVLLLFERKTLEDKTALLRAEVFS